MDTPGFGDSDGEDEELIEEMMDTLANTINHSDTILLLLRGDDTRFGEGLQKMINRMTLMFGHNWWDYVVVGVSFWSYSQEAINERCDPYYPQQCVNETTYAADTNQQIQEKFGENKTFPFVFTDSYSQTIPHIEDPQEQEHWREETGKLWDISTTRAESFAFMTIDDILEENAKQRAEIKWLNDVITNNISEIHEHLRILEEASSNNISEINKHFRILEEASSNNISEINEHFRILEETSSNNISEINEHFRILEEASSNNISKINEHFRILEEASSNNISEINEHFRILEEDLKSTQPAVGSIIAWLPSKKSFISF